MRPRYRFGLSARRAEGSSGSPTGMRPRIASLECGSNDGVGSKVGVTAICWWLKRIDPLASRFQSLRRYVPRPENDGQVCIAEQFAKSERQARDVFRRKMFSGRACETYDESHQPTGRWPRAAAPLPGAEVLVQLHWRGCAG